MSDQPDHSAILSVTRGDEEAARRLRATLAVVMRRTDDEGLRALIGSVLGGRESVRTVVRHPAFNRMAQRNLDNVQEGIRRLSPEERQRVMDPARRAHTPDRELDGLRGG